jgi:hypothetical protein
LLFVDVLLSLDVETMLIMPRRRTELRSCGPMSMWISGTFGMPARACGVVQDLPFGAERGPQACGVVQSLPFEARRW